MNSKHIFVEDIFKETTKYMNLFGIYANRNKFLINIVILTSKWFLYILNDSK